MEVVMYIIVNNDINMRKGKIASQCAHGASKIVEILEHKTNERYRYWKSHSHPKVVLKATEEQLNILYDKYCDITIKIIDEGRTQIEPRSFTVLAFYPIEKNSIIELSKLKLL